MVALMDICMFTIEHPQARRIFIRGVADISKPIDDYSKIIKFKDGIEEKSELPKNPYDKGEPDYKLFEELQTAITNHFEEIGDELVFADEYGSENAVYNNHSRTSEYIIEMEKVIL